TLGGILTCTMAGDKQVSVEMGKIRAGWRDIPLSKEMDTLHLGIESGDLKDPVGMNIGNPHAVFFVDDLEKTDLAAHGKYLQTHALFPEEANIGAAQILDSDTMKLDVWERPGNMTTACGTGACVAVAAARRRGLTDKNRMTVIMPAGSVDIEILSDNLAVMTGPVDICFTGYLDASAE
ncbi:MAG: diaminopimelate epimerase, partial [Desulfobacterales bacterium]|nr:diaminopimelate epimerase [Desulfobacterales bacterium]